MESPFSVIIKVTNMYWLQIGSSKVVAFSTTWRSNVLFWSLFSMLPKTSRLFQRNQNRDHQDNNMPIICPAESEPYNSISRGEVSHEFMSKAGEFHWTTWKYQLFTYIFLFTTQREYLIYILWNLDINLLGQISVQW